MIGLDTNVLARYYVEDKKDAEAERQRMAARRLIESGRPLMVCKTVILEFEWVLRGYYGFAQGEVVSVLRHLLALSHVTIEDRGTVEHALSHCDAGIDLLTHCIMRATGPVPAWRRSMTASLPGARRRWAWHRQ
jgi:predicted nucleic-acid-binding protein